MWTEASFNYSEEEISAKFECVRKIVEYKS